MNDETDNLQLFNCSKIDCSNMASSINSNTNTNSIKDNLNKELNNFISNIDKNKSTNNLNYINTENEIDKNLINYNLDDSKHNDNFVMENLMFNNGDLLLKISSKNSNIDIEENHINDKHKKLNEKQEDEKCKQFLNKTNQSDVNEFFIITNPATINFLKENLSLIRNDNFSDNNFLEKNHNTNKEDFCENFFSNQFFTNLNSSNIKNQKLSNKLIDFSNYLGDKQKEESNNNVNTINNFSSQPMDIILNNNNNLVCNLESCNLYSTNIYPVNSIKSKKFETSDFFHSLPKDDYLTEHNFNNLIIRNNNDLNKEIPKKEDDEDEEVYVDSIDENLEKQDKKTNFIYDYPDVETVQNQLLKLKIIKNQTSNLINFKNLSKDDSIEENDNDFFDAVGDYEEIERGPLIRSTSLKTVKTKTLEPSKKKMVRFADALGLDLANIKTISQEDLPYVPASAFFDLKSYQKEIKENLTQKLTTNQLSSSPVKNNSWTRITNNVFNNNTAPILSNGLISAGSDLVTPNIAWPILVPEFIQPFTQFNFLKRVNTQKVCLESCVVSSIGNNLSIDCIIRVWNISFEKTIMVRYTNNDWNTWLDSLASYIPNSCDGQTDKFSVKFYIKSLSKGQRVKFAIKYLTNNEEFWDNNLGLDYCLHYKA